MPCHIVKTESLYDDLKPHLHGFSVHELLGHAEEENPATFGIWALEGPNPISYDKLPFHGFIAVTEGEFWVEDVDNDPEPKTMHAGDIFHVTKGTTLKWGTPSKCKGIYVHLKPLGHPVFTDGIH